MEKSEILAKIENLKNDFSALRKNLKIPEKKILCAQWRGKMAEKNFWDDRKNAEKIAQKLAAAENFVNFWENFSAQIAEFFEILEIAEKKDFAEIAAEIEKFGKLFLEKKAAEKNCKNRDGQKIREKSGKCESENLVFF